MVKIHYFQELLQRELTRKEFLQVIGLMILSLIGVSNMFKNIDQSFNQTKKGNNEEYGVDAYGG